MVIFGWPWPRVIFYRQRLRLFYGDLGQDYFQPTSIEAVYDQPRPRLFLVNLSLDCVWLSLAKANLSQPRQNSFWLTLTRVSFSQLWPNLFRLTSGRVNFQLTLVMVNFGRPQPYYFQLISTRVNFWSTSNRVNFWSTSTRQFSIDLD